jgi:DNA polymerase
MTKLDIAFLERFTETIGPIGKSLGMLIRPTFIAAPGKTLVWGDFSNIEARVLPWLAASAGGEKKLDIFRAVDADPSLPDVYMMTAGEMLGKDPREVTKEERQSRGKVPELSLGFGGGLGALQKMAVNYKVYLDDAVGTDMVQSWRARNAWAIDFWGKFHVDRHGNVDQATGLWGAANMALRNPGTAFPAGRVAYVFDESYMGGTLFCALPCGRLITYPDCRVRTRKVKDKDTGDESEKTAVWYRKGYGWSTLWHGKCAEGPTQAVAASVLRETLVELDRLDPTEVMPVVSHTHDEVITECDEDPKVVAAARERLEDVMGRWRPEWRADLPLTAEVVENTWYTKSLG